MQSRIPILNSCTLSPEVHVEVFVERFATYFNQHKQSVFPHRHNFYHVVFFTRGNGTYSIDFQPFQVAQWQVYLMMPGQMHTWQFQEDIDGFVVNFSAEYFQSFLLKADYLSTLSVFGGYGAPQVVNLNEVVGQHIQAYFEQIIARLQRNPSFKKDVVKILLLYIFMLIDEQAVPVQKEKASIYFYTILKNFQHLVDAHFVQLKLPKQYADLLYITPN